MKVNVNAISAFTVDGKGGNIAGLVLDAGQYTSQQKQQIATQSNFSETAFVSHSQIAEFKLDFYTPVKQIPHCGHATIATFSYLKSQGLIDGETSSKETIDGVRQIFFDGDMAFMEQKPGKWSYTDDELEIANALNIETKKFKSSPVIVNTGNSFVLVELGSIKELQDLAPNFDLVREISEKYLLIGFYVYVRTPNATTIATTRMFAPLYGIQEESATGMAAGPLAWWLNTKDPGIGTTFMIRQGDFMDVPSSSNLHAMISKGEKVSNIFVGGSGSFLHKLEITI
ncbi:PhzF family phenazine biosynthesis protein [Flavobacterium wongokense]|uniref:PhzF family phenazine biosynthesis protein n=1 Tax=Flavobacterium wongokense TaxID=2910674 RepID=UPI001F4032E0|nr:PhzF family phenazine biosynthesis protein [Flavobacterium sp. WG47]MCF6132787.1 PhzF family phenazine biosynthesis protein [Flavobacterium sp. WG47]